MQVLKESKLRFVSAVGISLLTSFWLCLWSSHSSGLFVWHLWRGKVLPAYFKSAKQVLLFSSWMLQEGGAGGDAGLHFFSFFPLYFPFPVFPWGWGLGLGFNIHSNIQYCPVSGPCLQSVVQHTLSSAYVHQVGASNPPHCPTLWLVCEVHWVGANHTPPSPSLLAWACVRACANSLQGS